MINYIEEILIAVGISLLYFFFTFGRDVDRGTSRLKAIIPSNVIVA